MPGSPPARSSLFHRWFVQYNPVYLLSAALVLGGMWLLSREAAAAGSLLGQLGVAGLAELYAAALIGGAALLTRIGQRRAAVMLGLLVALYQGDLTMHVETSAYLDGVGPLASLAWWLLFVAKLVGLTWALELTPRRAAWIAPILGGAALAAVPHALRTVDARSGGLLVGAVVFLVGAAALWGPRDVASRVGFDVRGRRALLGAWSLWAALGALHAGYWVVEHRLSPGPLGLSLLLLGTRALRQESLVWVTCGVSLTVAGVACPDDFGAVAAAVAATLALRAYRSPVPTEPAVGAPRPPYRARELGAGPIPTPSVGWGPAPAEDAARLLAGALAAAYVAVWMRGGIAEGWPAHELLADGLLALATLALALRDRRRAAIAVTPLGLAIAHLVVSRGWLPRGALGWGVTSVALGFVSLLGALAVSWRRRLRPAREDRAG